MAHLPYPISYYVQQQQQQKQPQYYYHYPPQPQYQPQFLPYPQNHSQSPPLQQQSSSFLPHPPTQYQTNYASPPREPPGSPPAPITEAASPSPSPTDAIDKLNLRVLQRHLPSISSLIFRAPYVVVYTFSTGTGSWEKVGKEGTMFIVRLRGSSSPHGHPSHDDEGDENAGEKHAVVILNRRGMDNFVLELGHDTNPTPSDAANREDNNSDNEEEEEDGIQSGVQLEGDFIILQGRPYNDSPGDGTGEDNITTNTTVTTTTHPTTTVPENGRRKAVFGLWVFEEEAGSTAGTREECAAVLRRCNRRKSNRKEKEGRKGLDGGRVNGNGTKRQGQQEQRQEGQEPDLMALLGQRPNGVGRATAAAAPAPPVSGLGTSDPFIAPVIGGGGGGNDVLGTLFRNAAARAGR